MASIQEGFDSIQQSDLGSKGSCGTAARAVFDHFTNQLGYDAQPQANAKSANVEQLILQWNMNQQAVYLVCVNTSQQDFTLQVGDDSTGDPWKWEHYFVVHQDNRELMIYQAFVDCYNLGQWCSGNFPDQSSAPDVKYSPQGGTNVPNANSREWAEELGRFAVANKTLAGQIAGQIFGGGSTSATNLGRGMYNGLKIRWLKSTTGAVQNNNNHGQQKLCPCILL
jgi:hypothetical protein